MANKTRAFGKLMIYKHRTGTGKLSGVGNESSGKDRKRTENSESSKLNAETLAES